MRVIFILLPIAECFYLKFFSLFLQKKKLVLVLSREFDKFCVNTPEQKIIFPQNYLLHIPQVFKAKKSNSHHIPKILSSYIIFKIWTCPNLDVCSIFIRKTQIWKLWIQNDSLCHNKKTETIYVLLIYCFKNKRRKINSCAILICKYFWHTTLKHYWIIDNFLFDFS